MRVELQWPVEVTRSRLQTKLGRAGVASWEEGSQWEGEGRQDKRPTDSDHRNGWWSNKEDKGNREGKKK